jgi:hypothetical protein
MTFLAARTSALYPKTPQLELKTLGVKGSIAPAIGVQRILIWL